MADRATEAMHDLMFRGQAFICSGCVGGLAPGSATWNWTLTLFAPDSNVVAGVEFITANGKSAHIAIANVDQLDRLGRSIATTVGLMRKWMAESDSHTTPDDGDIGPERSDG